MVDIPAVVIAEAAAAAEVTVPCHASIGPGHAERIAQLVKLLASAANRSRGVAGLQRLRAAERRRRMPDALHRLERSVVEALTEAAAPVTLNPQQSGGDGRCDVEALKAWLASESPRRLRITELAEHSGVSARTVERAFLRTGCTALEYLRGVRLEQARRKLSDRASAATVAEAAILAGFTHLGRFSAEYRRRFGELPSQTLLRGSEERGEEQSPGHRLQPL